MSLSCERGLGQSPPSQVFDLEQDSFPCRHRLPTPASSAPWCQPPIEGLVGDERGHYPRSETGQPLPLIAEALGIPASEVDTRIVLLGGPVGEPEATPAAEPVTLGPHVELQSPAITVGALEEPADAADLRTERDQRQVRTQRWGFAMEQHQHA